MNERVNQIYLPNRTWEGYVHPRAREYFTSHEALVEALSKIAKNINKDEDPILVRRLLFNTRNDCREPRMTVSCGTGPWRIPTLHRQY